MKTLITPVGTSLFTNYLDKKSSDLTFNRQYERIKKQPASAWENYQNRSISALKRSSLEFIKKSRVQASAELQSIAKIQEVIKENLEVRLLASDTIASRLAAEILSDRNVLTDLRNVSITFNTEGFNTDVIEGLQVENAKNFSSKGMTNLIKKILLISKNETLQAPEEWHGLAINITGGFKATLPYLTILAQLKRVPLYYNFEDTDALIKIPQAPLVIDWSAIDHHSDILRQIDEGEGLEKWSRFQRENYQTIAVLNRDLEAFIEVDENNAYLSPIGEMFWNEYQRYFAVELPRKSYYGYSSSDQQLIDQSIEELYKRLGQVLSDTELLDDDQNLKFHKCYEHIHNLGPNNDLNHGGQIPNPTRNSDRNIFIFKSTNNEHIRLLYTFKVNKREITRLRIYDLHCGDFDHGKYIDDWKHKFGRKSFSEIDFVTRTFEIPT